MVVIIVALSMIHVSVSVANNFVHSSTAADQGFRAFGELARFVYCLLKKIKEASSLPLVEQWQEYVFSNHSRFPAIDEKYFLAGTVWSLRWAKLVAITCRSPSLSRRFCQLCLVNRCFTLRHWLGFELLLSCNCGWWGQCCSFPTFQ